jgi:hypothetical protein
VFAGYGDPQGHSQMLWLTDLLPEAVRAAIEQLAEFGSAPIHQTFKRMYRIER